MFRESEQRILKALFEQDNQSQTQLMRSTGLSYSTVMSNVRSLESREMVRVMKIGSDNRIALTEKGRAVAEFFSRN